METITTSSIDDFVKEINELKLLNKNLSKENRKLKKNIQKLQNELGLEICEFFHNCNSIRETAEIYYFEDVRDCYEALVDYNGCSDPLYDADDFRDCYKEIFDREYSEDDKNEDDTLIIEELNPEILGTCVSCEYIGNLEEGTECNNCGRWVCSACTYYCLECCS
jgi:hypothetical protein